VIGSVQKMEVSASPLESRSAMYAVPAQTLGLLEAFVVLVGLECGDVRRERGGEGLPLLCGARHVRTDGVALGESVRLEHEGMEQGPGALAAGLLARRTIRRKVQAEVVRRTHHEVGELAFTEGRMGVVLGVAQAAHDTRLETDAFRGVHRGISASAGSDETLMYARRGCHSQTPPSLPVSLAIQQTLTASVFSS